MTINSAAIAEYIRTTFTGLREDGDSVTPGWGEHAFYYNPESELPRGVYFVTLKSKATPGDPTSAILTDGIYRLCIRLSRKAFERRFGRPSRRVARSEEPDPAFAYRTADQLFPHPTGELPAVCVLNPSQATFDALKPELEATYTWCKEEYSRLLKARERRKEKRKGG